MMAVNSLTIAADKGQQLYRRHFKWKSVGIEIRGARSKHLNMTHRSTKQIIRLARSQQSHDKELLLDEDFLQFQDPETDGPKPKLLVLDQLQTELNQVIRKVKQLRNSEEKRFEALMSTYHDYSIGSLSMWMAMLLASFGTEID